MLGKWGVGPSKNGVTWGVLQLHLLCVCARVRVCICVCVCVCLEGE